MDIPDPNSKEWEVLSCHYFHGMTRDDIAAFTNLSGGTVSNIIANFEKQLEGASFVASRDLAVAGRKAKRTILNMALGARIDSLLARAGISTDEQKVKFVETFFSALEQRIGPTELAKAIVSMAGLAKETKMPLEQVPGAVKVLKQQLDALKSETSEEIGRRDVAKREANYAIASKNMTLDELKHFSRISDQLAALGIPVREIDKLHAAIVNGQDCGYSEEEIGARITEERSLAQQAESLRRVNRDSSRELEETKSKIDYAKRDLKAMENRGNELSRVEQILMLHLSNFSQEAGTATEILRLSTADLKNTTGEVQGAAKFLSHMAKEREDEIVQKEVRVEAELESLGIIRSFVEWFLGREVDELEIIKGLIAVTGKRKSELVQRNGRREMLIENYHGQLQYELEFILRRRRIAE